MSQSALWDTLLVAGDMLADRRYDECDAVLGEIVPEFEYQSRSDWTDAWFAANCVCDLDCECEPPERIAEPADVIDMKRRRTAKRPWATLQSYSAIYKQLYPVESITNIAMSTNPLLAALSRAGGSTRVVAVDRNRGTITMGNERMDAVTTEPLAFEATPVAKRKRVSRSLWRSLSL